MPEQETGEIPSVPTPASETPPEAPKATNAAELATELEKTRAALKAANKEAAERRKRLEELESAESKRKESEMSEIDKLTKRLQETEARLKATERTALQRQAAEKLGLPLAFASRLTGETPEELEADAKLLFEALPKAEKKTPNLSPTNPGGATQGETIDQQLARIHGQGVDPFDRATAKKLGGGVHFVERSE